MPVNVPAPAAAGQRAAVAAALTNTVMRTVMTPLFTSTPFLMGHYRRPPGPVSMREGRESENLRVTRARPRRPRARAADEGGAPRARAEPRAEAPRRLATPHGRARMPAPPPGAVRASHPHAGRRAGRRGRPRPLP